MEKIQIRKNQLETLKKFSETKQKKLEDQKLTSLFLKSTFLRDAQKIGITLSMPLEVDTSEIIAQLWEMGKDVYIPRCLPQHQMEFTEFTYETQLTKSKFGVQENQEPDAIVDNNLDLLVVPLLAYGVDQHARLGFGGGYYDRYLAKNNVKTVSLVNSKQLMKKAVWTIEDFDVPIENYLTV